MIQYDSSSIYLIGGNQIGDGLDDQISKETWIFDPTNEFSIKKGPPLNIGRSFFSCGKLEINGKILLVVAGGRIAGSKEPINEYVTTEFVTDTVELLDPTSREGWIMGIQILSYII